MAWEDTGTIAPLTAGAAITLNRFVKVGAADNQVILCAAATDIPLGVAKTTVASGAGVGVQLNGVARMEAGAAITRGAQVGPDATGRAIAAIATSGVGGIALEAASAAGEIISVALGSYAVKA